jgi:GcrA cell cycle regulator
MEWNEDVIGRLRELWTEGHSTAEIGRRLGVSKNAIVGKAHRLELAARPSPIRRESSEPTAERRAAPRRMDGPTLPPLASTGETPASEPAIAPVAEPVSAPVVAMPVPMPVPVAVVPLPVQPKAPPPRPVQVAPPRLQPVAARPYGRIVTCCWPIGEPGTKTFRFCDDRSEPGKPYCDEHAKLAYVKVRDRREDAA